MIDTDKYTGHTPAPWRIEYGDMEQYGETDTVLSGIDVVALDVMRQDVALLADAPLLLAEVKRIQQDTLKVVSDWFDSDENEWRRLEQALGLPLTPLSWEGGEE